MASDYKELRVWQAAMELAVEAYRFAATLPAEEKYGLRAQITRAAASVPSNIAEGNSRLSRGEYLQFLGISRGSLAELETQALLSTRLGWKAEPDFLGKITAVRRQLQALIGSLRSKQ